jgi:ABC-2 type transport system permease protein
MNGPINLTVTALTFRQLFTRRRLVGSALFALSPLLITLVFRATAHPHDATGLQFLRELYSGMVAFVLLPLSAVVFGTAAFGGEIDDGTIVYLLVKDLPRWQIVLSKYVVAVVSTFVMIFVAILLPWLALGAPSDSAPLVQAFTAGIALGAVLYSAIFVTLGMMNKRALVLGLLYI